MIISITQAIKNLFLRWITPPPLKIGKIPISRGTDWHVLPFPERNGGQIEIINRPALTLEANRLGAIGIMYRNGNGGACITFISGN